MLRVVYKATYLGPGMLTDWRESRGRVEIRVARGTNASQYVPSLNDTLRDLLSRAHWFQIWEGEVVSVDSPDCPLRVTYELSRLTPAPLLDIREHKGHVAVHVPPSASAEELVQVLNPSLEEFLAGGQWFQLWRGEIVTMDSPDSIAA